MGMGKEIAEEAMLNAMIEEDIEAEAARKEGFERLRGAAQQASTIEDLKTFVIVLLNLIEERM